MAVVSMKSLLETGVHFGHRTRRWNPKMRSYIFTERNGVHIIDLQQTISMLGKAYNLVRDTVAEGGTVLFVGTKRQAQETIPAEAQRCGMPYVSRRWLGGTLTNWRTIRQRIEFLLDLEARRDQGEFERLTKKEGLVLERQIEKLNQRLGGIKEMHDLPSLLFVVDILREATAVAEANKVGIPIVAMVDTNCNPDPIDHIIPANDDAIRAIKLLTSKMADAVLDGLAMRKAVLEEPEDLAAEEFAVEDEKYLSAATLARLKELSFEDESPSVAEENVVADEVSEPAVAVSEESVAEVVAEEAGADAGAQASPESES